MKTCTAIAISIATSASMLIGCSSTPSAALSPAKQWRSKHFNVSATLTDGWQTSTVQSPGDTYDRPTEMMQAFLNPAGPYSYIIKLEQDAPLEELPLQEYLTATREQFTSHAAYELIDEVDLDFHGKRFHRFRFKVAGTKGPASMYTHIFRDGSRLISVQWTFPISADGVVEVPGTLAEFDNSVTIDVDAPQQTAT